MITLVLLVSVLVLIVVAVRGRGERAGDGTPWKGIPAHAVAMIPLLLFGVVHGLSKISGGAPVWNAVSGGLLLALLLLTLVSGLLMMKREWRGRSAVPMMAHRIGAAGSLICLIVHVVMAMIG